LEALALAVYGTGDRAPGWFARKLARECVDPRLSCVFVRTDRAPDDPRGWLAFALVGTPPSLVTTARTAGIGVHPDARNRGLGSAIVERAFERVISAGYDALQIPAAAREQGFFARAGFRASVPQAIWSAPRARAGDASARVAIADARPWTPPGYSDSVELSRWLPEAWERDPGRRVTVTHACGALAHVSVEGTARLIQRVLAPPHVDPMKLAAALRDWTHAFSPHPLMIHGVAKPPRGAGMSLLTIALTRSSWRESQPFTLMTRSAAIDKPSTGSR
jgi:GNAT superfamily N-acetyltransferase